MDPRTGNLETTTFLGRRLTRRQVAPGRETVEPFPDGSRREPGRTPFGNPGRRTSPGTYRERSCLRVPGHPEGPGVLTLPERRVTGGRRGPSARTEAGGPWPNGPGPWTCTIRAPAGRPSAATPRIPSPAGTAAAWAA